MPPPPKIPYALYQRAGSSNWWVRFSIQGEGQIRKSLGTTHQAEAERLAFEAYGEARHRKKLGLRSQPKTFQSVAEEFVAMLQGDADRGDRRQYQVNQYRRKIQRYMIGFFGDRPMDQIREADVIRFMEWRRAYWTTGPGKHIALITYMRDGRQIRRTVTASQRKTPSLGSQREDAVVLRMLLRQAGKWGYIAVGAIPKVEARAVPANGRPSFTADEFARLSALAVARLSELKINAHLRRDRAILYSYIRIAASTGMRPTELKNLNWGDVLGFRECRSKPTGQQDIRIQCRGKGQSRTCVPLESAIPWFGLLWERWESDRGAAPTDADPVFATPGGMRLGSVKNGLIQLLKAANLLTDHRGLRRTSYSFRHFYITQQLIAGVDIFKLAKNTGTSSDMIERFYADVNLESIVNDVRPIWR